MIAYDFEARFEPLLTSGAKALTLCLPRKPPARHARAGEPIGLWTGMRTKDARRAGAGLVLLRALVRFGEEGILQVSDLRVAAPVLYQTERLERELCDRNGDALAQRDGFPNWFALWRWHDGRRTDEERAAIAYDPCLMRELVAWRPLAKDEVEALDCGRAVLEDAG